MKVTREMSERFFLALQETLDGGDRIRRSEIERLLTDALGDVPPAEPGPLEPLSEEVRRDAQHVWDHAGHYTPREVRFAAELLRRCPKPKPAPVKSPLRAAFDEYRESDCDWTDFERICLKHGLKGEP